ncbi:hypothetical protein An18g01370 [Aspergillus niger]|uniref:Uncharacterized protein n=2 Tax=Aspergillus niger TaxID=5061 RepID=E2PT38_ASPNC|nr:hypothetical protein An18g01370 [Aspergillus niger]CAK47210.1 hypothetical protein An18g01370 [Aspergillus niger]
MYADDPLSLSALPRQVYSLIETFMVLLCGVCKTATLPLELLHIIGDRLRQKGVPLAPCTTVSRWWKDVFEAYIYIRVVVRSTKAELEAPLPGLDVLVVPTAAGTEIYVTKDQPAILTMREARGRRWNSPLVPTLGEEKVLSVGVDDNRPGAWKLLSQSLSQWFSSDQGPKYNRRFSDGTGVHDNTHILTNNNRIASLSLLDRMITMKLATKGKTRDPRTNSISLTEAPYQ